MNFHPLSELFPLMQGREFDELVADVKANGLREPIWTYDGQILDGRNRWLACETAQVATRPMREYAGDDPVSFVVSLNLHRRHLDDDQRRMVGAKIVTLTQGRPEKTSQSANISREQAAALVNADIAGIDRARKVVNHGAPELVSTVESGRVSVSAAADVAELPKEQQREIVAKGEKEILEAAKQIRAKKSEERREERLDRVREISAGNVDLSVPQRYPVIYADPPWRYDYTETEARAIENQYPTMDLDAICSLPIREIATEDAVLFLWGTSPKLVEALRVIEAWGFCYRTCAVWAKPQIGMGYYFRQQHELLLVATRGSLPAPAPADRVGSVITADRKLHSAKPAEFAAAIERMYPTLPKIELFCRSPRDGWAVWGNQSAA